MARTLRPECAGWCNRRTDWIYAVLSCRNYKGFVWPLDQDGGVAHTSGTLLHGKATIRSAKQSGSTTRVPRGVSPWAGRLILAGIFSFCCTFTSLALVGAFRALVRFPRAWADSLSENAYGIYIIHYVFVIWVQFLLLSRSFSPAVKFAVTFPVALGASWFLTALRRTVASRVL